MMNKRTTHSACTSVLVGKQATLDGSTLIARNEDNFVAIWPKRFIVKKATSNEETTFISKGNQFTTQLPKRAFQYTATPDVDPSAGYYEESGINEKNVAMSATESAYANPRVLALDPLIDDGIAEDAMLTVILPYISSAREGIERLGSIVEVAGAAESNGVLFSDAQEVWYMEIATGHHWVAQRIPDDSYAVVANQLAIQQIDFSRPNDFMWDATIQHFVEENHLNPNPETFNFRKIFGTQAASDLHYNTPRVWFGQRYLTPSVKQKAQSFDLPFIQTPDQLVSVADVCAILSSHYNETEFDPLAHSEQSHKFRAISLSRTQNSHVLQIRNHVQAELAGIQWLAFGVSAYSAYVPFFTNASQTAENYSATDLQKVKLTDAYWLYRSLAVLAEGHHAAFQKEIQTYRDLALQESLAHLHVETARLSEKSFSEEKWRAELAGANAKIAQDITRLTEQTMGDLMKKASELSELSFDLDQNL